MTMTPARPAATGDIYQVYRRLQGLPNSGETLVRYDDVRTALNEPALTMTDVRQFRRLMPEPMRNGALAGVLSSILAFRDGPGHHRLRKIITRRLSMQLVSAQRPVIERISNQLLDDLAGQSGAELRAAFTLALPAQVIGNLLGVGGEDLQKLLGWSRLLVQVMAAGSIDPVTALVWEREMAAMRDFIGELVARHRPLAQDNLLSALIAASDEAGDDSGASPLSAEELSANVLFMVTAGHETTTDLLGSAIVSLLRNPGQLARLRAEPALVDRMVEETLRFESPVQMVGRVAARDVPLGGRVIRAGRLVNVIIGAANRDPNVFADPDTFDITREPNPHLAFGHGLHYCPGAGLARLEARIALPLLLQRFPRLRLADPDVTWQRSALFRGPARIPVHW